MSQETPIIAENSNVQKTEANTTDSLNKPAQNRFQALGDMFRVLANSFPTIENRLEELSEEVGKLDININGQKVDLTDSVQAEMNKQKLGFELLAKLGENMSAKQDLPSEISLDNFGSLFSSLQSVVNETFSSTASPDSNISTSEVNVSSLTSDSNISEPEVSAAPLNSD